MILQLKAAVVGQETRVETGLAEAGIKRNLKRSLKTLPLPQNLARNYAEKQSGWVTKTIDRKTDSWLNTRKLLMSGFLKKQFTTYMSL